MLEEEDLGELLLQLWRGGGGVEHADDTLLQGLASSFLPFPFSSSLLLNSSLLVLSSLLLLLPSLFFVLAS